MNLIMHVSGAICLDHGVLAPKNNSWAGFFFSTKKLLFYVLKPTRNYEQCKKFFTSFTGRAPARNPAITVRFKPDKHLSPRDCISLDDFRQRYLHPSPKWLLKVLVREKSSGRHSYFGLMMLTCEIAWPLADDQLSQEILDLVQQASRKYNYNCARWR